MVSRLYYDQATRRGHSHGSLIQAPCTCSFFFNESALTLTGLTDFKSCSETHLEFMLSLMCERGGPGAHLALQARTPSSQRENIPWHFLTTCRDVCPKRNHRWGHDYRVLSNNYFFSSPFQTTSVRASACVYIQLLCASETKAKGWTPRRSHTKEFVRYDSRLIMSPRIIFLEEGNWQTLRPKRNNP